MDGWNSGFLLGWPIFRCYVSFREGISYLFSPLFGEDSHFDSYFSVQPPSSFNILQNPPKGPFANLSWLGFVTGYFRMVME